MNSNITKKIIREIAAEEGMSEWAVRLIVSSQFENTARIIRSAEPDNPNSFKDIRLNAFCNFKVIKKRFSKFKGRDVYEKDKRDRSYTKKIKISNKDEQQEQL
jgi:hypothetical protein